MLYRLKENVMIETKYVVSLEVIASDVIVNLANADQAEVHCTSPEDAKVRMEVIAAVIDRLNGID